MLSFIVRFFPFLSSNLTNTCSQMKCDRSVLQWTVFRTKNTVSGEKQQRMDQTLRCLVWSLRFPHLMSRYPNKFAILKITTLARKPKYCRNRTDSLRLSWQSEPPFQGHATPPRVALERVVCARQAIANWADFSIWLPYSIPCMSVCLCDFTVGT